LLESGFSEKALAETLETIGRESSENGQEPDAIIFCGFFRV